MRDKKSGNYFMAIVYSICILICIPPAFGQNEQSTQFPQLLFPNFEKGIIKLKTGKTNTAILNYNTVDEEMLFEQNASFFVINRIEDVDTIFLQKKVFVPVGLAFYEVVANGKLSIFIQHKNKLTPMPSKSAYGLTSQVNGPTSVRVVRGGGQVRNLEMPANMTTSPATLYWVRVDGEMYKFTNEKQFLKIFPDKQDKIKAYIKKSNIDLKSPDGLKMLGVFCNELIVGELMK